MQTANTSFELDKKKLPRHIAIIMDGNGRWAKKRSLPRISGHIVGAKRVSEIVRACNDLGIKVLSLYAFSTENWSRPKTEISALMKLLQTYLTREMATLMRHDVRLTISGNIEPLPETIQNLIKEISAKTLNNRNLILNLCINYGGRREILDAFRNYSETAKKNPGVTPELTEENFHDFLYYPEIPDVDLMIRTSGEERISNFLLWRVAYSELYFTQTLWPDFRKADLYKALHVYQQRERRFGGI